MARSPSRRTADEDEADSPGAFEVRADYIEEDELSRVTSTGDWFEGIHKELLSTQTAMLVGPRGCGKTHMMRFTWMRCREDPEKPLAVYVSFNRYLRLEPWMQRRGDARRLFNAWVLALVAAATADVMERMRDGEFELAPDLTCGRARLTRVIERLESHLAGDALQAEDEEVVRELTVPRVVEVIRRAYRTAGRRRAVVLLDDAALTLTPDFMIDFFDVVRATKQADIAPKCSVYPGTQYGPRFHVHQEATVVPVWLDVENPKYPEIMRTIVELRNPQAADGVGGDASRLLMYAAFGVPRAYLVMMGKAFRRGQSQADMNRIIQELQTEQLNEFRSIEQKLPHYKTLIKTGEVLFGRVVQAVVDDNLKVVGPRGLKQLLLGLEAEDEAAGIPALASRMMKFLVEAGLLYEFAEVKHGGMGRTYERYGPHMAALISNRAFSAGSRGWSPAAMVANIERPKAKHPVRRKLKTLLSAEQLASLRFDLPACPNCGAKRLSETQKFCHECSSQLPQSSTYFRLMSLSIDKVPNLSRFARESLKKRNVATIQDLMAIEDPGTELRKVHRVGRMRAEKYLGTINQYVNETLLS